MQGTYSYFVQFGIIGKLKLMNGRNTTKVGFSKIDLL